MIRKFSRFAMLTLALTLGSRFASAEDVQACGLHTLAGSYGFRNTGILPGNQPAAFVGVNTFDGKGNLSGRNTGSVNGNIFEDTFAHASYTVDRDCTGTLTFHFPQGDVTWNIVIVDNGKRVFAIATTPGITFTSEAVKQ